ncbi:MAG TPA: DUF58 domain-containing protein, partial [Acidimicrobiales bacterium]|nr:DUF58 domain-containing protein [Acidimicrobiales bacterium]
SIRGRFTRVLRWTAGIVTPVGRVAALLAVGVWIGAWASGWEELALLASVMTAAFALAVLWTIGRPKLAVDLIIRPPRVVVGERATAEVTVTNASTHRQRPLRLEVAVGEGAAGVALPTMAAGAVEKELLIIPTARRAVIPIGPVTSVRGDPLGILRREIAWSGTYTVGIEELFVHARTVMVGSLTTGRLRDLEGETSNDRSPSDVAFHTLREYVPGDDRRHIHWRTTARRTDGKLMVREYVDTRRVNVALLLSLRARDYANEDEFELAVSAAASIGDRTLRDGEELTLLAGRRLTEVDDPRRFGDEIARIAFDSDPSDPATITRYARTRAPAVSVVVLVAGSGIDRAALRSAADQLGANTHAIVVRAAFGTKAAFHVARGASILEIGALEDLPRLIWTAAAA